MPRRRTVAGPDDFDVRAGATPTTWLPGDPGYFPLEGDPPEDFFHVVAAPTATDEKMALLILAAYEQGKPLELVAGRRYLVNAADPDDAVAQVERIEIQIAENDPVQVSQWGPDAWVAKLVVPADSFLHARRDPEPAMPLEALSVDPEVMARRRTRAIEAGLG